MADISTLVKDINQTLVSGAEIPEDLLEKFKDNLGESIRKSLSERGRKATLRMSSIGQPCERKLYYEINEAEGEPLRAEHYMKFMYGALIEELLILLTKLSGHDVQGEQDTLEIQGIKGHRDGVIDGVTSDFKSASSYSFKKFQSGGLETDDPFGYIGQGRSYVYAATDDPVVTDKRRFAFLVADKVLGHICLDIHEVPNDLDLDSDFQKKKELVVQPEPPARSFEDEPFGKSGNRKLGLNCSYCPFWKTCWPKAREFLYSNGPVKMSVVTREPDVPELK